MVMDSMCTGKRRDEMGNNIIQTTYHNGLITHIASNCIKGEGETETLTLTQKEKREEEEEKVVARERREA